MSSTESPSPRRNGLIDLLAQHFIVFRECRPLALGIHKAILTRLPEVDPAELRAAMRSYSSSTRYLKALLGGRERFNLDGQPEGEVTDEQRQLADETLKDRFRRAAQGRKLDEQARRQAAREAEAEQKRKEKLGQLVARFNQR